MYLKSLNDLEEYVENLYIEKDERLIIFVGDASEKEVQSMSDYLNSKNISFFGGIYPKLLVGDKSYSKGYIVNKINPIYGSTILPSMMRFKEKLYDSEKYTAILIGDGLSSKFKELIDTVYNKLGKKVRYLGGGAGFYNLTHKPCVFDNTGIFMDTLYVCIIKSETQIAVEHGWSILKGPFHVTSSNENVLSELDNENAFQKYKEILEDETGLVIYPEDFFTYAKEYPFGIMNSISMEVIVRDPICINENLDIVCVADIPNGCYVCVLNGDNESLLEASLSIANRCKQMEPPKYKALLFDCISRAMFLEDDFTIELVNIQDKINCTVEGTLSIGEITSKIDGSIVVHNKSTVIGLIEDGIK